MDYSKRLAAWEDFLDPEVLRPRLIAASVYLAIFEMLKSSIVDHPRNFYANRFTADGAEESTEYKSNVLSLDKSRLYASLKFLRDRFHAITDSDMSAFERVKKCRNLIAHQLFQAVSSDGLPGEFADCLREMTGLLRTIEQWWLRNVELAIADDVPTGADLDKAFSGTEMMAELLAHIALSPLEEASDFLNAFRKISRPGPQSVQ